MSNEHQGPVIWPDKFRVPWWVVLGVLVAALAWRVKEKGRAARESAHRVSLARQFQSARVEETAGDSAGPPVSIEEIEALPRPDLIQRWYLDARKFASIGAPRFEADAVYLDQPDRLDPGFVYGRNGLEYAGELPGDIDVEATIDLTQTVVSSDYVASPGKATILSFNMEVGHLPRAFQMIYTPAGAGDMAGFVISSVGGKETVPRQIKIMTLKITRLGDQILGTLILDDFPPVTLGAFAAGDFDDTRGRPVTKILISAMRYDPAARDPVSFALKSVIVSCVQRDDSCRPAR